MKPDKLLIIPDYSNIEQSIELAKRYNLGFEYNDFFFPSKLIDDDFVRDRISFYNTRSDLPAYNTMHGAFFDVLIFSDDPDIRKISEDRIERSLRIAKALGVRGVVFHTNHTPNFIMDSYIDNWVKCNEAFFRSMLLKYPELDIYMENMFDMDPGMLSRLGEAMKDCEHFGICFDYAHASVFGKAAEIEYWVKSLAPYVKHLHINDNCFDRDSHLALGDGMINWQRFKEYYKEFSNASVLIEVNGYEKQKKSLEYLLEV